MYFVYFLFQIKSVSRKLRKEEQLYIQKLVQTVSSLFLVYSVVYTLDLALSPAGVKLAEIKRGYFMRKKIVEDATRDAMNFVKNALQGTDKKWCHFDLKN